MCRYSTGDDQTTSLVDDGIGVRVRQGEDVERCGKDEEGGHVMMKMGGLVAGIAG